MTPALASPRRARAAFTLVELLAAAALSTLLLSAGFQILRSVARVPTVDARLASPAWRVALADRLRADLAHAVAWQPRGADGVLVAGYAALDAASLDVTHRPATVAYRVELIGDRRWLVREQVPLDERRGAAAQLVCEGVTTISIASLDPPRSKRERQRERGTNESPPPLPVAFERVRSLETAPVRARVVVTFADPGIAPLNVEVSR